jgi:hypothetical protein|tara:strand:- start:93 stop:311 length:219 start_codon:yes stop_codon:yes gene_type:complete
MEEIIKDISEQLLNSYKVLDDVRAKLENINDDIVINELDDQYHSDLSETIQDWLGRIYSLDCDMAQFVKDEE